MSVASQSDPVPQRSVLAHVEDPHAVLLAEAQCQLRDINVRIYELSKRRNGTRFHRLVCECPDLACFTRITVASSDYEAVRRFPTRFLIAPSHLYASLDRPVEDKGDYLVVEKVGVGASVALKSDPGRRQTLG